MAANLDIDLLRTFTAVADCGSFTAAAQLVARTQSAVSLQVKRLEELLGRKVFERTSRSLALTREGATLLGYARRMLELNDESVRRMVEPPVAGDFRLGITEYFIPAELPQLLARFAGAYPGVRLEVRMGLSADLRRALKAGELDTAQASKALWKEPQRWVAGENFEASREVPLPLVLLPEPCVLRQHAIDSMRQGRRKWTVAFTGSSMASVQAAVKAGLGVSIVPASSIAPGMRALTGRPYRDPGMLHIGLVHAASARTDIVRVLEAVMRQTFDRVAASRG